MSANIESIPEKTRWEIATKGLTGAYIAISNALKQAVGQQKFEEFNGALWYQAGTGAKEFAASLGLPTETAGDVHDERHHRDAPHRAGGFRGADKGPVLPRRADRADHVDHGVVEVDVGPLRL